MTEQMTLEQVRDIMSDYIYPATDYVNGLSQKMLQQWMDAIDAHLNAAKDEVDFDTTYHGVMIRKMAEMLSNNEWADLFTGDDAIASLQEQISRLVDNKNAAKSEAVAWRYRFAGSQEYKYATAGEGLVDGRPLVESQPLYTNPASPEVVRDALRYRWLRDKSVHFELPDRGTPYCVYGLGMGDSEPTWGTELDSMVDYSMNQDAAMAAREGGE